MVYNKDELTAPTWMHNDFFKRIVENIESDTIEVINYEISPGSNAGDHFASIMFRVKIEYKKEKETKNISLIIKTLPVVEGFKKDMLDTQFFDTEIAVYTKILPEIHRILKSVGDDTVLGPILHYFSTDPHYVVVFEDLKTKGFEMKYTQLNLEEAKMVFTRLAKWHAAVMVMEEYMPEIKSYDRGIFAPLNEPFYDFFNTNLSSVANIIRKWPKYGDSVAEKILKYRDKTVNSISNLNFPNEGNPYNLLIHGDFHFKNMMFIKKGEKYSDVIFVDYQMSVYTSGAIDLIYGLYNAVAHETRVKHRDEIVKHYYEELTKYLKCFGYMKAIPSLYDLHLEIMKASKLEVVLALLFTPFITVDFKKFAEERPEIADKMDFNEKSNFDDMIKIVYEYPKNVAYIQENLDMFLLKGLLE